MAAQKVKEMLKDRVVTLPTIFTKMSPKVDRSWKLEFVTRELQGKEVEILANRLGTEGWIAHSPNDDIELEDLPKGVADSGLSEGRTPSKRLRNTLFVLWQQEGEPYEDFNRWYEVQMNKMIDVVKERLE